MNSISEPTTELMEMNCGSMTELLLQVWLLISFWKWQQLPCNLTVFNNELYFRADDGTNGDELWKYDGTNAPSMVADTNSGSGSSYPAHLTVFNNELYFRAYDISNGHELWKYDGTNAPGMVADIFPGSGNSDIGDLTVFNNELYFRADDGTNGDELWKYDGTNAPSMVADINSGINFIPNRVQ